MSLLFYAKTLILHQYLLANDALLRQLRHNNVNIFTPFPPTARFYVSSFSHAVLEFLRQQRHSKSVPRVSTSTASFYVTSSSSFYANNVILSQFLEFLRQQGHSTSVPRVSAPRASFHVSILESLRQQRPSPSRFAIKEFPFIIHRNTAEAKRQGGKTRRRIHFSSRRIIISTTGGGGGGGGAGGGK